MSAYIPGPFTKRYGETDYIDRLIMGERLIDSLIGGPGSGKPFITISDIEPCKTELERIIEKYATAVEERRNEEFEKDFNPFKSDRHPAYALIGRSRALRLAIAGGVPGFVVVEHAKELALPLPTIS